MATKLAYGCASRWYCCRTTAWPICRLRIAGPRDWPQRRPLAGQRPRGARRLRRLQSEVQMQLYTHPMNDATPGPGPAAGEQLLAQRLRPGAGSRWPGRDLWTTACAHSALNDDWAAWCKAWDSLDASALGPTAGQWPVAMASGASDPVW